MRPVNHLGKFGVSANLRIRQQFAAIKTPWLLGLVCIFFTVSLFGQGNDLVLDFNVARINHQEQAMLVLGGWAVTNIGLGAALRGRHTGPERYFHDMNIYWNLVNLGIAGLGYYTATHENPETYSLFTTAAKHYSFQKVLLFNAGLDIGYVLGGLYLTERSRRGGERADQLKGFGKSVMLQGGFLFAFDLVNYYLSSRADENLNLLLSATPSGLGISFVF